MEEGGFLAVRFRCIFFFFAADDMRVFELPGLLLLYYGSSLWVQIAFHLRLSRQILDQRMCLFPISVQNREKRRVAGYAIEKKLHAFPPREEIRSAKKAQKREAAYGFTKLLFLRMLYYWFFSE